MIKSASKLISVGVKDPKTEFGRGANLLMTIRFLDRDDSEETIRAWMHACQQIDHSHRQFEDSTAVDRDGLMDILTAIKSRLQEDPLFPMKTVIELGAKESDTALSLKLKPPIS
ncbi:MAG: hypothetical protein AAF202_08965 [Pseudomonadota bacterium]